MTSQSPDTHSVAETSTFTDHCNSITTISDFRSQIKCSLIENGRFHLNFDDKLQHHFQKRGGLPVHHDGSLEDPLELQQHKHQERKAPGIRHTPWYRNDAFKPVHSDPSAVPRMNVAILITGSRGDVQPFIALGQRLKKLYGHRVRIGTHPVFKQFVEENDLEFYSISGDPAKLLAYMVKNPGILPTKESMKAGEVSKRRAELEEMMQGSWRACTMAGDGATYPITAAHPAHYHEPFVADAIISNPPTYGALHIAEKLCVPLHSMFTMPWSPTTAFPHPLANLDVTKVDAKLANFMSYNTIELLTWEGIQDLINRFREGTLGLDSISPTWGYLSFQRLRVPFTYCWSEALIPKPADWGAHIGISGFFFLPLASTYKPDSALSAFLEAGPSPLYFGFGSIVIDDPDKLTKIIYEAVERTGSRAIISKGWAKIGKDPPPNCHVIDNVPHDWLFTKVSAVCHHGGAGTTSAGLALAKPTIIIPFFGDQPFWGGMVARAGAGPVPVPYKDLTADKLTHCIEVATAAETLAKAAEMAAKMKGEDGVQNASEQFQRQLEAEKMKCFIFPGRVAVWRVRKTNILLSSLASGVLVKHKKINPERVKLVHKKEWLLSEGAPAPVGALIGAFSGLGVGLANDIIDYNRSSAQAKVATKEAKHRGRPMSQDPQDPQKPTPEGLALKEAIVPDVNEKMPPPNGGNFGRYTKYGRKRRLLANMATHAGRAPVALLYNLANGFHNAPEFLLGDGSVRRRGEIDSLRSGLRMSVREGVMNTVDAFVGLVRCPYNGFTGRYAEDDILTLLPICHQPKLRRDRTFGDKLSGATFGVVQGVAGFPLKLIAAALSLPAYSLKGLEREIQRWQDGIASHQGRVEHAIVASRVKEMQGKSVVEQDMIWMATLNSITGNPVVDTRVWQSHRESRSDFAAENTQLILDAWDSLKVPDQLSGLDKPIMSTLAPIDGPKDV